MSIGFANIFISGVADFCSELMSETSQDSIVERRFELCAVIAALLSIPAILMQTSESHLVHGAGNVLNVFIWLFFALEVTVLLSLTADDWAWIRSHKLELIVVVGTAPVFSLIGDKGVIFGLAPLLLLSRVIRFAKITKFLKVGKLLKTNKIIEKDETFPKWVDQVVFGIVLILIIGLIGMIVDKEAHSISQGIKYWFALLDAESEINEPHFYLSILIISVPVIALFVKVKRAT